MQDKAGYIVGFAAAVCVVCALFVSSSAVGLKARQKENQALDKQKNVLYAAGLAEPEDGLTREQIQEAFSSVQEVVVDLESGQEVSDPPFELATYDADKAAEDAELGMPAPDNMSSISRLPKYAVVYQVLGDGGQVEMVVLPIKGYGLWSTLYGFLALDKDANTIRGITYYDHKETPGLGGEVDNPRWKALWPGREAFDQNGAPVIEVIKGQAGPPSSAPHQVDGLSGATITSRGVTNMLNFWLGEAGFGAYLKNFRERQS